MVLYRDHRGLLEESMATTRAIATKQALADDVLPWINQHSERQYTADDIDLTHYGYDDRVNWNCWIVTLVDREKLSAMVLGFTDGPFPEDGGN